MTKSWTPNPEVSKEIAEELDNLLESLLDRHSQPIVGEFFLELLRMASDLKDSLDLSEPKTSIIEEADYTGYDDLTEEEKSQLN